MKLLLVLTIAFLTAAQADIAVLDILNPPGTALSNNQIAPVDFGSHPVPTMGGVTRLFRVKNIGAAPLSISSVTASPLGIFGLTSPTPPSLAPGATFDFSVRFSTNTPGTFTGNISILSNSLDNPSFTFPITATPVTFPSSGNPVIVDTIAPTILSSYISSSNPTTGWARAGDTVYRV